MNVCNQRALTLSVMSLSASSRMSRVKSLMVSRVIELFWRRCLHVERETFTQQSLEPVFDKLLLPYAKHKLSVTITLEI